MTTDAASGADDSGAGARELRARALRALSWSTAATLGGVGLTLVRSAVLSRLLLPEEFGLFGLVLFALAAVSTFTDLGLGSAALISRFEDPAEQGRFLDTAWTAQLVRSFALGLLVVALAGPYADAVHQPRLAPLLAVGAASLLLGALASPGTILLYQRLEQRTLALLRLATDLFALAITALLAWVAPSAWALVVGALAAALFGAAVSYAGHPYRPRLAFDRALFRRGFAQGRYLALVVALTFVTTQVDNLIVGRSLGAAALGLYLFAYRLASLPIEQVQQAVGAVALPTYTRLRAEGPAALARQLRLVLAASTAVLCAGLLPAALLRRELVLLLGGARWLEAETLLLPLFLLALLRCTTIHHGTLLQAMERAELDARGKLIEALFFVPACAVAVQRWGLLGACWAGALTYALALALRSRAVASVLPGEGRANAAAWGRPALAAFACAAAGLMAERSGVSPLLVAPVALALFAALALRLDPALPAGLRRLLARGGDAPATGG